MSDLTMVGVRVVKTNAWGEVRVWTPEGLASFASAPGPGWKEYFPPIMYMTGEADLRLFTTARGWSLPWATVTESPDRSWWLLAITFDDGTRQVWRRRSPLHPDYAEAIENADYDFKPNVYRWAWPD